MPNYFWWETQKEYRLQQLESYTPAPTHQKKFFCQVRSKRGWRTKFFDEMNSLLDQALWSYVEKGIYLPGDKPNDFEHGPSNFQRYVNTDWYNNTDFTVTVESSALPFKSKERSLVNLIDNHGVFLSEKSYKPMAMFHPFMIMGQPDTLKCIHTAGFETFPELWDESYDDEIDFFKRIALIKRNIEQFDWHALDNSVTQEKLRHNRNRFWDQELANQAMKQQIIDPVLKFLNIR